MGERGLRTTLVRTKTVGKAKRLEQLPVFASIEGYFADPRWLEVGWELWQSEAVERDYFLMAPKPDRGGAIPKEVSYHIAAAMSRALLLELRLDLELRIDLPY